jgi:arginine/lysine/ornithine decarboxylase
VRNAWGLMGPMRWDLLDEEQLRRQIRDNPLVRDSEAWRKRRPFRVAVVEQCTCDGSIHSAEMIIRRIGHLCDYIDADNAASLTLHERFGFNRVGLLPAVAYRHGRWSDTVMVQRALGPGATAPPPALGR